MIQLWCRLLGTILLTAVGFAAGRSFSDHLRAQWQASSAFEHLLTYLADQLEFYARPSAELLSAAAFCPEFAVFCPQNAAAFADLQLPKALAQSCGAELHAGLNAVALCSRKQAPQTMRALAAMCRRAADSQYAAVCRAAGLAPKLGLCSGLLAAVLLWPAG